MPTTGSVHLGGSPWRRERGWEGTPRWMGPVAAKDEAGRREGRWQTPRRTEPDAEENGTGHPGDQSPIPRRTERPAQGNPEATDRAHQGHR